jgi:hypothetical protein
MDFQLWFLFVLPGVTTLPGAFVPPLMLAKKPRPRAEVEAEAEAE